MGCKNEIELDLYRDGLKIITTIDSRLQTYAEDAVSEGMRNIQKHLMGTGLVKIHGWTKKERKFLGL
jgi:membrane carboxypeptidase/penicillin-binding protein